MGRTRSNDQGSKLMERKWIEKYGAIILEGSNINITEWDGRFHLAYGEEVVEDFATLQEAKDYVSSADLRMTSNCYGQSIWGAN